MEGKSNWMRRDAAKSAYEVARYLNSQQTDDHIRLIGEQDPTQFGKLISMMEGRFKKLMEAVWIWKRLHSEAEREKAEQAEHDQFVKDLTAPELKILAAPPLAEELPQKLPEVATDTSDIPW